MSKRCEVCGKFMHNKLHGACLKCLKDVEKLPPGIKSIAERYEKGEFSGKTKRSARGVIRAALTLVVDGDWFAVEWDPVHVLQRNVDEIDTRPWISPRAYSEMKKLITKED